MQNSTMSLPNRSHSVAEMATINGDQHHHHHHRRTGLTHSNSSANNSLLYQRSLSYVKTITDNNNNFESAINGENLFHNDKYNTVNHTSFFQFLFSIAIIFSSILLKDRNSLKTSRSYNSTTNGHSIYHTDPINHVEADDIYRLQRLYHHDESEKYNNRFENDLLSNTKITAKNMPPAFIKTPAHETK